MSDTAPRSWTADEITAAVLAVLRRSSLKYADRRLTERQAASVAGDILEQLAERVSA
jgi:hypothetical protein